MACDPSRLLIYTPGHDEGRGCSKNPRSACVLLMERYFALCFLGEGGAGTPEKPRRHDRTDPDGAAQGGNARLAGDLHPNPPSSVT